MRPDPQFLEELTRRQLLRRTALLAGGVVAGPMIARLLHARGGANLAYAQTLFERVKGLPPEVTSNKDFYVVSKNPPGFDPVVNVERWNLEIAGLVSRPAKLSYDQVRNLPSVERHHTLECISNEVGGDLISNAKWRGSALRDVLGQAGDLSPKTVRIAFRCADGYTEAIPLADALNPETLLVHEMNGERLPNSHGFPVRLLAPGLFGMKNPKWITKIEAVDHNFQGYWERSGWSDKAVVQTMSKFTTPRSGLTVRPGDAVELGGVAYAGNRGIRMVEFSPDDGKTWQEAEVKAPLGKHTWVLWAAAWKVAAAGDYRLRVRATDGLGARQTSVETATLPNGATGHHRVVIKARG